MIVLRSYATWTVLAAAALVIALFYWGERGLVDELVRVVAMCLMLMLVPSWAEMAWRSLTARGWPSNAEWGGLALFLAGLLLAFAGAFSLFYRLAGQPRWLLDLPVTNAWAIGLIVLGVVFNVAPRFFGAGAKRSTGVKRAHLVIWVASAALVVSVTVARPDLAPIAEWLHRALYADADAP